MQSSWLTESLIANPMSVYPEYWQKRSSWYRTMDAAVVEVQLEDGTKGFGFVGGAKGISAASIIDEQFRDLVIVRSGFDTELLHEQLYRASIFYGLGGLAQCVISGIDIALWDAKGKLLGKPVYNLIGGRTRERLKSYYTGNDPDESAANSTSWSQAANTNTRSKAFDTLLRGVASTSFNPMSTAQVVSPVQRKLPALAEAHHIQLICHGVGSPTYQFLISNDPHLRPLSNI